MSREWSDAATDTLRATLVTHHPDADLTRIDFALRLAAHAHAGTRRRSGHPYLQHPLAVGQYIADWGLRPSCVEAALLHDVGCLDLSNLVPADLAEARMVMGDEVMNLALTMSTVGTRHHPLTELEAQYDHGQLRELLLLKLADRLHNAQTWEFVPPRKARRKAVETQEIIIPWAEQLGLPAVAAELTTLANDFLASPRDDLSPRLFQSALDRLPPRERERYAAEWSADLASLPSRRERTLMALGLLYSARAISRQRRAS